MPRPLSRPLRALSVLSVRISPRVGFSAALYLSTTGPFNSFDYPVYSIRPRLLCCARTGTSLRASTHDQTYLGLWLLIRSFRHVAAPAPFSMAFGWRFSTRRRWLHRSPARSPGTRAASLLSQTHAITSATFYDSCSLPNHGLLSLIYLTICRLPSQSCISYISWAKGLLGAAGLFIYCLSSAPCP
ncbi:uncharacterized protein BDV14DRAFT_73068 [Aspergillus stella-maris]|uniref:uncharacterized protein n=1 Tax=Aspergillus stella-maris TaxID=1810926 RepID=UPI003CCCB4FB